VLSPFFRRVVIGRKESNAVGWQLTIERMVRRTGEKAVLVPHSMGTRVVQYFLNWLDDEAWIETYLHGIVSLGGIWRGSPSGSTSCVVELKDAMMDMFCTSVEKMFNARMQSIIQTFPPDNPTLPDPVTMRMRTEGAPADGPQYAPLPLLESVFRMSPMLKQVYEEVYLPDVHVTGGAPKFSEWPCHHRPPPVRNLWCVYGTNISTQLGVYLRDIHPDIPLFRPDKTADRLSNRRSADNPAGLFIAEGRLYETATTVQPLSRSCGSGDGTVPYASLNQPRSWLRDIPRQDRPNVCFAELPKVGHFLTVDYVDVIADVACGGLLLPLHPVTAGKKRNSRKSGKRLSSAASFSNTGRLSRSSFNDNDRSSPLLHASGGGVILRGRSPRTPPDDSSDTESPSSSSSLRRLGRTLSGQFSGSRLRRSLSKK